jgi:diguanylate cyclase (GGDEF)-like protein/PAS domain S-box-containing protein
MADVPYAKLPPMSTASFGWSNGSFHETLLDSLYDGVYFVDTDRRIQYWNRGAELLTGYSADEIIGKYCFDNFLSHVDEKGCALCLEGCPLAGTIADGKRREADVYLRHKLGHRVPVGVRAAPIADSTGRIVGAVEVFSDATARRNIEKRAGELAKLAYRDDLTGVPNRRYIELKVRQAVQEFQEFGRSAGLLMMDIDRFKQVNDENGHETGDDALRGMCQTLTHNLRPGDLLGRWGGEEFLAIVTDINAASLAASAERCRMLIARTAIPVRNGQLRITVSVGATLFMDGDTHQAAVGRADELMYKSKVAGGNRVTLG